MNFFPFSVAVLIGFILTQGFPYVGLYVCLQSLCLGCFVKTNIKTKNLWFYEGFRATGLRIAPMHVQDACLGLVGSGLKGSWHWVFLGVQKMTSTSQVPGSAHIRSGQHSSSLSSASCAWGACWAHPTPCRLCDVSSGLRVYISKFSTTASGFTPHSDTQNQKKNLLQFWKRKKKVYGTIISKWSPGNIKARINRHLVQRYLKNRTPDTLTTMVPWRPNSAVKLNSLW